VSAKGPIFCKSRGEGTVLFGGDAAEDAGHIYKGFETLIAIGTQAGKVLVFNILGLLIHEIVMDVPVIAVEWVGDMSAPSALPSRVSSLSPEPRPVVDKLVSEVQGPLEEESGTVKKAAPPHKHALKRKPVPVQQPRNLFSDDHPRCVSGVPSYKLSEKSNGSPLRVERTRARPGKKSFLRPRISTETFQSPPGPSSASSSPLVQDTRRWPQIHHAPNAVPASRARRVSAPHASVHSSENSDISDPEWFTPPSTRRDKGKAPERHVSPETPIIALQTPMEHPIRFRKNSPTALDTPTSSYSRSTSDLREHTFTEGQEAGTTSHSNSLATLKTAQRHVTIATPESTSPFDSPTILYSHPNPEMFKKTSLKQTQDRTAPHALDTSPLEIGQASANLRPDTPSSVYSCSTTGTVKKTPIKSYEDKRAASRKPSSSSLDNLYSPLTPRNFSVPYQKDQNANGRSTLTAPAKAPPRPLTTNTRADSPSSVYSRSISGIFPDVNRADDEATPSAVSDPPQTPRHHLSIHALGTPLSTSSPSSLYSRFVDGPPIDFVPLNICEIMATARVREHDAGRPRTDCSFDAGTYDTERKHGQIKDSAVAVDRRDAVSEQGGEMACLRADQKDLRREMAALRVDQKVSKQEIAALRNEFRALRDVLLRALV
jgi:hypothetical protein